MAAASNTQPTLRKTVSKYNLVREYDGKSKPPSVMASFSPNCLPELRRRVQIRCPKWKDWLIVDRAHDDEVLVEYSVSPDGRGYYTGYVVLEDEGVRMTDMRYRDMLIDNYISSTGRRDCTALDYLITDNIVNRAAQTACKRAFAARGKSLDRTAATEIFRPDEAGWSELVHGNPFAQGQMRMLAESSGIFGAVGIREIVVVSRLDGMRRLELSMITVFDR
ncbi:hypothetical protein F4778DRAFT_777527 [Xylariomycetidae sp. FL2044]|nr:hypothetical protein F4778DRAFT_777527 [Xylariomycetidae sp. FL2044]